MKDIDSINEFKHVIKTWKPDLICAHADFAKFIYKILDIRGQQKNNTYMYTKIHICLGKPEYHNRFFPFALRCTFTFPCLVIYWNLWNLFKI